MSYAYLEFLDFSLTKLNEIYPNGAQISRLASMYKKETGIWIDRNTQQHFEELYKNKFFQQVGTTWSYKISPETKEIIDRYGSFSAHIKTLANEILEKRQEEKDLKKLQTENLKLQNENFEHLKTIRKQESIIRSLDLKIKVIELIKSYRWIIGFLLAILITLLSL